MDGYSVYVGPMPDTTVGIARTYTFSTEDEARRFAEHTKAAAWADHGVDRRVIIRFPQGFQINVVLEGET